MQPSAMPEGAEKVIPLAVLRAITSEPVLPRDPSERAAQADRIRKLMEGQPLHVRGSPGGC
jgi:hypothetical protein